MLAYFWGKGSLRKDDTSSLSFFLRVQSSSHQRLWDFCCCLQQEQSHDLSGLWNVQIQIKIQGFFFFFRERKEKRKTNPKPNQTKTPSSSRNKTNKGTEKKVFLMEVLFPTCFHILYSTLKTGTQDVKPWKQLDATRFLNYFCQGLDFGDFIFSYSLIDSFPPTEIHNMLSLLNYVRGHRLNLIGSISFEPNLKVDLALWTDS